MRRSPYIFDRRRFLTGLGLAAGSLCLPSLPGRGAFAQAGDPKRLLFYITPHGTVPSRWTLGQPGRENENYDFSLGGLSEAEFSDILRPLHRHRDKLLVVDALARMVTYAEEYRVYKGGASGDINRHHIGQAGLLCSTWPYQGTSTARGGSHSIDQEIGNAVGQPGRWNTRVYGDRHQHEYTYVATNQPAPREDNPQNAFNDILGLAPEPTEPGEPSRDDLIRAGRASALDVANEEFAAVLPKLGSADREKLERHRALVRDLEVSFDLTAPIGCDPSFSTQGFIIDQFSRICTMALACDLTRVITLVTEEIRGPEFGLDAGLDIHQDIAHESNDEVQVSGSSGGTAGIQGMVDYNRFYAEHFAYLLDQLDSVQEGNGTLLDNTAVVWLTELGTGTHRLNQAAVVIAGGGGGYFRPGRFVHYARNQVEVANGVRSLGLPHERLHVSLMHAMGMTERSSFGLQQVDIGSATISLRDPLPLLT